MHTYMHGLRAYWPGATDAASDTAPRRHVMHMCMYCAAVCMCICVYACVPWHAYRLDAPPCTCTCTCTHAHMPTCTYHAGTLAYRLTDLPRGRTDDAFAILLAELQRHSLQRLARPAQPMALPMAQPRPHRHQISPHRYQISPHEEHQQLAVPGAQPRSRIDVSSIDAFTSAGG